MPRTVYLNGQFIPEAEAKLSIYDLSVMQSAAAFEMTRSFNGQHFKLREHLDRLIRSCELLSLPLPRDMKLRVGISNMEGIIRELTAMNDHGPGEEHRLLIVVSPGCAPMYRDLAGVIPHPFVYIADFPLRYTVQGFSQYFLEGVHCVTSKTRQVPDACVPSAAKHRSRLHFHLAQQQAPAGTWPLLTDISGWYTEAPGANLVQVTNGIIHAIDRNALPGISLQTIRELTHVRAGVYHASHKPDELWLTGTPFCMLPVVSLDGKPIGTGKIGPVYQETLGKWNQLVGLDIAQQIHEWDYPKIWTPDAQRTHTAQH